MNFQLFFITKSVVAAQEHVNLRPKKTKTDTNTVREKNIVAFKNDLL